jgi:adenylate cyclase
MGGEAFKQRLAAVLAADAVGYSRLMAGDERATVSALDNARAVFRDQIEANQGRVVDMAGDSVLAVFETASGAVAAALSAQQRLAAILIDVPEDRRMRFRIGVHLGEIIEKADGTVYGDGVNIAARLEGLAAAGGLMVSDLVRSAVKGKVSAEFEDLGEQAVKNIAEPVRAFRVNLDGQVVAPSSPASSEIDLSLPDKPSIAVLPFTNLSGDPDQEYFTDGITEDIITELSRFQSLFVIARNSSFSYKGKSPDVRQVSKELGVRYVLEGSIRRTGNRVRVTGQLIDSITGKHIWAERYDRVLEDIFAVQEELTECIVTAIAPHIDAAEMLRARRRPGNLGAYELAVRAMALGWDGWQKSDGASREESLRLARAALAIDAESIPALNAIGFAQWQRVNYRSADEVEGAWQEGMDAVNRSIELAQSVPGYAIKAMLLSIAPRGSRWDEAFAEAETACRLNPQDPWAIGICGFTQALAGDPSEGIRLLERLIRINPRDPFAFAIYAQLAIAYLAAKDYRNGLQCAMRLCSMAPNFAASYVWLANMHVGLGETDKAKSALETARKLGSAYVQARLDGLDPYPPDFSRRYVTFLRVAAGIDDPSAADALR